MREERDEPPESFKIQDFQQDDSALRDPVACARCGRKIEGFRRECPHCGVTFLVDAYEAAPVRVGFWQRRWVMWVIVVLVTMASVPVLLWMVLRLLLG